MPITRRYLSKKRKRMTLRDKRKTRRGGNKSSQYEEQFGFSPVVKKLSYAPEETSTDSPSKTLRRSKKGTFGNQSLLLSTMDSPLTNPDRPTTVFEKPDSAVYGFPETPDKDLKYSKVMDYILNIFEQRLNNNEREFNSVKGNKRKSFLSIKTTAKETDEIDNISTLIEQSKKQLADWRRNYLQNKKWSKGKWKDMNITNDDDFLEAIVNVINLSFASNYNIKSLINKINPTKTEKRECNINWGMYPNDAEIQILKKDNNNKKKIEEYIKSNCAIDPENVPITVMAAAKKLGLYTTK